MVSSFEGGEVKTSSETNSAVDRWPIAPKAMSAGIPRRAIWDVTTELPSIGPVPDETYDIMSKWIDQCSKEHDSCASKCDTILPKRILRLDEEKVYLHTTQEEKSNSSNDVTISPRSYACLSHCWGKKGPKLKLTGETMPRLYEGISTSNLPKTFKDAVKVCQSLKIFYLWIDALCKCFALP